MYKVIIVDDTIGNQEIIRRYFEMFFADRLEVVDTAIDVEPALTSIHHWKPDLIIMDIQLRTGTGFDILDELAIQGQRVPHVIFVTAYGKYEYATKAFEYSAIDFVTKPIDPDKFQRSVQRALDRISSQSDTKGQVQMLLDYVKSGANRHTKMAFHRVKGLIEFIEVERIIYCEADGSLTKVYLSNGEVLTAMRHLGNYSNILIEDFRFYPISNKTVVNMDYVKSYNHAELALTLTTGQVIYASRRGGADFRRLLQDA